MKNANSIFPYLLISFFFGISFVIPEDTGADSIRYAEQLEQLYKSQTSFNEYSKILYSEESTKLDVYQPILTWIVSRFTGNYQWLFGFYGIVFGYFWFKSILLIRTYLPIRLNVLIFLSLLFFILINPIWQINGVRMWTAVQAFFYGLLLVQVKGDRKGYIFLILPIFIHFSLSIALAVYTLFRLLPTKNYLVLYIIYILTFFIGEIDFEVLRSYFDLLPGFMQSRKGYISEDYAEGIKEGLQINSAYLRFYRIVSKYTIVGIISWIFFKYFFKRSFGESKITQWFAMALFFSAFSNLASQIPSGGRFYTLSNLIVISCFLLVIVQSSRDKILGILEQPLKIILLFIIIVQIRMGFDYMGIFMIIGNPIVNIFTQDKLPLIDFVKAIF